MKKQIISMMLLVALVVTVLPMETVQASEIVVQEGETEVSAEDTQTEEVKTEETQTEETQTEEIQTAGSESVTTADTFAKEFHVCTIGETEKVIGSNGVAYDEVTYLSADAVRALDNAERAQYVEICDEIASWIEGGYELNSAVIALDANGDINLYWSIPTMELCSIQNNIIEELQNENVSEVIEDGGEEAVETQEGTAGEDETQEEPSEEVGQTETEAESKTEAETVIDKTENETEMQSDSDETESEMEVQSDRDETESETEAQSDSNETEGQAETEPDSEMTEAESETEESIAGNAFSEIEPGEEAGTSITENMDVMPEIIEDSYEVTPDVPVEVFIDLGYDDTDAVRLNAKLPSAGYFYDQLQGLEKNVFDAGKSTLTAGKTSISFSGPKTYSFNPICQGISALILTYSDKFDWMDLSSTGGMSVKMSYRGSNANYQVSITKSPFYSGSLETSAKNKVKQLATAAQNYAQKNYPSAPAYGVVCYFDKWICENNYYNNIGVSGGKATDKATREAYYYCHSSYGILLKGYGVCESYALAMSRLLDAVGIKNMYVTGQTPGGGHAWNYIQMPDKKWYLQDSTWNDNGSASSKSYLLTVDDGRHKARGNRYTAYTRAFKFATLNTTKYTPVKGKLTFEKSTYELQAKKTVKLSYDNDDMKAAKKKWTSSNTKVAKVSSNGTVTAVGPGTATIELTGRLYGVEMKASCVVNVYQVKSMTFDNGNKTSLKTSCGIAGDTGKSSEAQTFTINIDRGDSNYTAQQMVSKGYYENPVIKVSNEKVASATCTLKNDQLSIKVQPLAKGSTKITVKFAGKTATLNYSVKQKMNASWFDTSAIVKSVPYTGKAYTPKITKTESAPKDVTFKVTHTDNKNAGTATVTISGTGKYGGEFSYNYKITPVNITEADFTACTKSKIYSGAEQKATTTVKMGKKKLSAGKDYDIYYSGKASAVNVGTYTVSIKGKGNYTGTVKATQPFEITANNITKMKVSCPSKVKYTGSNQDPVVVKIGNNVLPVSEYTVTYHKDSEDGAVVKPNDLGKYVAVITPKGKNVTVTEKKTKIVKKFTIQ